MDDETFEDLDRALELFASAIKKLVSRSAAAPEEVSTLAPAVPRESSLSAKALVCLDCGGSFKMLKKHLEAAHNLAPEEYRQRWGLAPDYPMTAPAYSIKRSGLAKRSGLGLGRKIPRNYTN